MKLKLREPVYLAGKMTGEEFMNFPAFDAAEAWLRQHGVSDIVNPAQMDRDAGYDPAHDCLPSKAFVDEAIERDIDAVKRCKSIVMLPGWKSSKGATTEFALAQWIGLDVHELADLKQDAEKPIDVGAPGDVGFRWRDVAEEMDVATSEVDEDAAWDRFAKKEVEEDLQDFVEWHTIPARDTDAEDEGFSLPPNDASVLPEDAAERKKYPMHAGVLAYFPNALALVARRSWEGNQQHNPGLPLHWDRSKSGDELDAMMRHVAGGEWDAVAWRALAHLEKMTEAGYNPYK